MTKSKGSYGFPPYIGEIALAQSILPPACAVYSKVRCLCGFCATIGRLHLFLNALLSPYRSNFFPSFCQHSKYCSSSSEVSSANFVGWQTKRVSNMKASVLS